MPNQKCGVKEDVSGVGVGLLKAQGVEQGPVLKYTQNYMYNIHNMQNMQNIWYIVIYLHTITCKKSATCCGWRIPWTLILLLSRGRGGNPKRRTRYHGIRIESEQFYLAGLKGQHVCRTGLHCHAESFPIWGHRNPGCDYHHQPECASENSDPWLCSKCWFEYQHNHCFWLQDLNSDFFGTNDRPWGEQDYLSCDQQSSSCHSLRPHQCELQAMQYGISDM